MGEAYSRNCGCGNYLNDSYTEQRYHPSERQTPSYSDSIEFTLKRHNYTQDSPNAQNTAHEYSLSTQIQSGKKNIMQKLELKVLASATLQPDTTIQINYTGLENSLRERKDGFVFFGSKKKSIKEVGEVVNDFIIPSIDNEVSERHRGNHFYIRFDENKNCFKIKDLGIGLGVFKQIQQDHVLKDNQLVNSGLLFFTANTAYGGYKQLSNNPEMQNLTSLLNVKCYIDTSEGFQLSDIHNFRQFLVQNKQEQWSFLKLSFYGGHTNDEKYVFCTNLSNGTITIGRDVGLNLISYPNDSLLSKCQSTIKYDNTKGWILVDLESTNGVWVYIGEEVVITDGMKFKANHTMFQAQIHGV